MSKMSRLIQTTAAIAKVFRVSQQSGMSIQNGWLPLKTKWLTATHNYNATLNCTGSLWVSGVTHMNWNSKKL